MRRAANNRLFLGWLVLVLSVLFFSQFYLQAAILLTVSDTISTSAPSLAANHTLKLTLTTTIPPLGQIIITPQAGAFSIPNELDYTDIDFLSNDTNKSLAASPGSGAGSPLGVSVTSGSAGKIIFTLNNADGLSTGSVILIKIGANAVFGQTGDKQIINPTATGSDQVRLETKNASGKILDEAEARVAIVSQVTIQAAKILAPPSPPGAPPSPPAAGAGGGLPVAALPPPAAPAPLPAPPPPAAPAPLPAPPPPAAPAPVGKAGRPAPPPPAPLPVTAPAPLPPSPEPSSSLYVFTGILFGSGLAYFLIRFIRRRKKQKV